VNCRQPLTTAVAVGLDLKISYIVVLADFAGIAHSVVVVDIVVVFVEYDCIVVEAVVFVADLVVVVVVAVVVAVSVAIVVAFEVVGAVVDCKEVVVVAAAAVVVVVVAVVVVVDMYCIQVDKVGTRLPVVADMFVVGSYTECQQWYRRCHPDCYKIVDQLHC